MKTNWKTQNFNVTKNGSKFPSSKYYVSGETAGGETAGHRPFTFEDSLLSIIGETVDADGSYFNFLKIRLAFSEKTGGKRKFAFGKRIFLQ